MARHGRNARQPEVVRALHQLLEHQEGLLARVLLLVHLHEVEALHTLAAVGVADRGARGRDEEVPGRVVREDLEGLVDAHELLGAQAAALVPLVALRLARIPRGLEDLLVGALLLRRRRERGLRLRELRRLLRRLLLLAEDLALEVRVRLRLRGPYRGEGEGERG